MKIPYGRQNITKEDLKAVEEALQSDFLTQGPAINEFENKFAEYVGAKYAVAVSNGTAALHLSALALKVDKSSNVLCTSNTFVASSNSVLFCGGKVDFCDIDPENFLLDLDLLEQRLDSAARGTYSGVIPVDFAGYPIDSERLKSICDKHGLWIIEDACHAPGASFIDSRGEQQKVGNCKYSDITVFSFHPVKHIATGEGGMITTNNKELYEQILKLRTHGITKDPEILEENHGPWYYEMHDLGYNYRITDMQCALGISQLTRAKEGVERRREIAEMYNSALSDLAIDLPKVHSNYNHAYHLYVIRVENRKELYSFLREKEIYCQIHYIPVHTQPFYKSSSQVTQRELKNCDEYYSRCLSIPMYPSMTNDEVNYVIQSIASFYKK